MTGNVQTDGQPAAEPYVHPDELELRRLEAELAAEEAGQPKTEEQEGEPAQPAQPDQPEASPPAPETPPAPEQINIPKQRFDEVLSEMRQMRERDLEKDRQIAFLAGQIEARKTGTPADPVPAQQQDPIAEAEAKIDALYQSYDAGEIGMAELKRQERDLQRKRDTLEAERNKPSPQQVAQQIASDPYLLEKTTQLETENPWLASLAPKAVQHSLLPYAYQLLADRGITVGNDVRSTLALRYAVVQAGKELGFDQRGQGASLLVDQKPQMPTVDQRRQKNDLARTHPPAITNAGTGAANGQSYTAADIDRLSDVDLMSLPASLLEQIAPSR